MKDKKWNIVKFIIIAILLLELIYFIIKIQKLNILPTKIFLIIIAVLLVVNVISGMFIMSKKKKLDTIGIILAIIIVALSSFGVKHINTISNFLNKSFNNNTVEVANYKVLVLNSSNYNSLNDLEGKTLGYTAQDVDEEEYKKTLNNKISINMQQYDSLNNLYDELLNNNIDSIVVSEGFLLILEDEYEDLYDNVKIIYDFDVNKSINNNETTITELKPVNILISGSDSRSGKIENKTRSDVNMIMTINPKTNNILLTSIPRDYYVRLHGTTGLKDKLTHAGIYGINMTKQTLEDLFNIKIDYTIKVGFQSVIQLVDLLGGIEINSDKAFTSHCGDGGAIRTNVTKGINHFNGGQALSYARERYAYVTGDNHRVQNQQQVLEAIIEKIASNKDILSRYDELLASLSELYRTDIPSDYIKLLVKKQLNDMEEWEIDRQQVSGSNSMQQTYSMPGRNLYVMIPNNTSVEDARDDILYYLDEE